jgi:glutamate-1-semialdehyde 2,1-aminomutase
MNYKERLHKNIPGGAHTYSRGDDQYPSNAPSILSHAKGAWVFDPQGNKFLDYGMGLRSVNIGYAHEEIAKKAYEEILKGNNLTRPSLTELEAAETLVNLIPSVDMVKFAKHGSTVTTAALKLARAYTNRKIIALPIEQPFFSFDDWFIGSTVVSKGTLEESNQFTKRFKYNDLADLKLLFDTYPNQIACVMMEAATHLKPSGNYLKEVQKLCHENGALFIIDEMITGFRWHLQGAQTYFDIQPDLSTFGKAMANGFAVAALGGKREIMELGSILNIGQERVFLTSTTHGAEMSSLGAFLKTLEILKRDHVLEHFWEYGSKLSSQINEISKELGILDYFYIEGYDCSPNFVTKDKEGNPSLTFRTLFLQEMINKNVMIPCIALSFSHQSEELEYTLEAIRHSLKIYKSALEDGVEKYLKSDIIKPVFRKYN